MLNFLKQLFGILPKHFTGLLPDTRPQYEKEKDYLHEERSISTPENPFGNTQITVDSYPDENQFRTSSCLPHAVTGALENERVVDGGVYTKLSRMFPYRLRSNYPKQGSSFPDIFNILRKKGSPMFSTLPTPSSEEEANLITLTSRMYDEATLFKGKEYYSIKDFSNIDALAEVAQLGHAVPIIIFATVNEWGREYPEIQNPNLKYSQAEVQHSIRILPRSGFMKDGKKYVTIKDSSRFGAIGMRHLSEEFIKLRCYASSYWDTVEITTGVRPKYQFTRTLKMGMSGEDIKQLQNLLISEGLLPKDLNTGYWGGRTEAGYRAFQSRYASEILIPNGLTSPNGIFGQSGRDVANRLCA